MKKLILMTVMAAAAVWLSGCSSFEYEGQSFDPENAGAGVKIYWSREEIPEETYRIIGRGELKFSNGDYDKYDIEELFEEKARQYGAEAVCILPEEEMRTGLFDIHENDFTPAEPKDSVNPMFPNPVDSVGKPDELKGEIRFRRSSRVRGLFLLNKDAVKRQLALRGVELDKMPVKPQIVKAQKAEPKEKAEIVIPTTVSGKPAKHDPSLGK